MGPVRNATAFVGRMDAVTELTTRLDRARSGSGALVLVAGEAGIGKTTLVERVAEIAAAQDVRVFWGGCWEAEGQPPYWPFVQILRRFVLDDSWPRVEAALGEEAPWLAPLLPERKPVTQPACSAGEQVRFRLFDTFTRLLADVARERPVLVVVEDLHWADEGTLRYLDFLGRQIRDTSILVMGTYRDANLELDAPAAAHLPALTQMGRNIDLKGMSVEEVGELLQAATGHVPDAHRVAQVHARSGGNPLFARELARARFVGQSAAAEAVPIGVSHVVNGRLTRMLPTTVELLRLAAVLGNGFDVHELAQMADRTALEVRTRLDEALRARILAAATDGERMEFLHALVRDTLYRQIPIDDIARLHRRAGEALVACGRGIDGTAASRLAYHFALGDCPELALKYATTAGEYALRALSYEDAANHFRKALELQRAMDTANAADANEPRRCALLLHLGEAQWRSGQRHPASVTYQEALTLARQMGDTAAVARAALGCCARAQLWEFDAELVHQLEEALAALGESTSLLRAQVMARLAKMLYLDPASLEYRTELAERAVTTARQLGDPVTLIEALAARTVDNAAARLETANEIFQLAGQMGDERRVLECQLWRVTAMLEWGDRQGAELALGSYGAMADKRGSPLWQFYHRCMVACLARMDGLFDESEARIHEAAELAQRASLPRADVICQHHLANLALDRGRRGAAEAAVRALSVLLAERPLVPAYANCILSRLQVALGADAEAWRCLDRFLVRDTKPVVAGPLGAVSLVLLTEMADGVGAQAHAPLLFAELAPYAAYAAVSTRVVHSSGPMARALGLLASMLNRPEEAEGYFEMALALATRMAAHAWIGEVRYRYARFLLAHPGGHGRRRGLELARHALQGAAALGMVPLQRDLDALLSAPSSSRSAMASRSTIASEPREVHPGSHTAYSSRGEQALTRVGKVIGQYRIERILGIGGMAAVYVATHRGDGHRVAIKIMLEHFRDDPAMGDLLRREAFIANEVGHLGAVPVLAHDVDEDGCAFLIMPLLEGETLRTRWERVNKRLPISEVAVLMSDVLDVLASAHDKGIIHRDIKPENIFVTTAGRAHVLDFGIARRGGFDGTATMTGHMIGTPAFMPPEQAIGKREAVGPHSDCWAAGATIFTMLSGEFVHATDNVQAQLAAAATMPARPIQNVVSNLPTSIARFIDKALAFEPVDRWQTGREMHDALLVSFQDALGTPVPSMAAQVRADLAAELARSAEGPWIGKTLRPR